ncbi:Putative pyridoxal phosphate-dependent aminotransferase EpsN [Stieleria neptunia]|uniref:Pyridoxal phosphate-dependent aminotransferase EpsN n=1 Tax=Stieleria neptunia TaxID=2527979 RepID=A0A518HN93_9BACT|nr:DegT/DnrJ/EryC1/StrS family aminotransferase [Stieleria neptunia]QDV42313.1 Putative pyridoxal phosphate-dependent aminotransferase EpsN [Stieleria neptunia]
MNTDRIFLSPPHMAPEARDFLVRAYESNWIAPVGPDLSAFENEFADYVGAKHAVAVSSGTAALHLALKLTGVGPGDVVPVSTMTFVAPANAVCYTGAEPLFVDSELTSWNMNPDLLRIALERLRNQGRSPKAIVVVDVFGQCAHYDPIRELCHEFKVTLIEDAAESLGATYRGCNAGTLGDIGCFSFNGNKMMTISSGGMLVTDNPYWAEKARHWATQARDDAPHYEHSEIGFNYRMSNLLAAIGRGQLLSLDARIARRREIYQWYNRRFASAPGIELIPESEEGVSSCWLTCILVDRARLGVSRDEIRIALDAEQIESRPCWKPMHLQPVFAGMEVEGGSVADLIFERGLCLPSGSSLMDSQLERIAGVIERLVVSGTVR